MIAFLLRAWLWIKARPAVIVSAFVAVAGFLYLTRPKPKSTGLDAEGEKAVADAVMDEGTGVAEATTRAELTKAQIRERADVERAESEEEYRDDTAPKTSRQRLDNIGRWMDEE